MSKELKNAKVTKNIKTGITAVSAGFLATLQAFAPMTYATGVSNEHGGGVVLPKVSEEKNAEQHIHKRIPFVKGKLAMNMERIDRTNGEIEFSIDREWLAGRKIRKIAFSSVKWNIPIKYSDGFEASKADDEWSINVYESELDTVIPDMHDSKRMERIFWIKPVKINLGNDTTNDMVFMLFLDDGVYYNGRVTYSNDCMPRWSLGYSCRAKGYDESKEYHNVSYEAYRSPRKYINGQAVRAADGYAYDDNRIYNILTLRPGIPDPKPEELKPEAPKPETPGQNKPNPGQAESNNPKSGEQKPGVSNTTDPKVSKTEPGKASNPPRNNETKKENQILADSGGVATGKYGWGTLEARRKITGGVLAKNEASKDFNQEDEEVEVESLEGEGADETNQSGVANDKKDELAKDKDPAKDQMVTDVPKLGDTEKGKFNIFGLWWVWLLIGTGAGAVLVKIFLSVITKREKTISN